MVTQACAIAEEICKQPWETYLLGADNSHVLEEGEFVLLGASNITAIDKSGNDASADVLDNTDKVVLTADEEDITTDPITNGMLATRIKAGVESLSKYKITFRAITSLDNQYETDVRMKIKDT